MYFLCCSLTFVCKIISTFWQITLCNQRKFENSLAKLSFRSSKANYIEIWPSIIYKRKGNLKTASNRFREISFGGNCFRKANFLDTLNFQLDVSSIQHGDGSINQLIWLPRFRSNTAVWGKTANDDMTVDIFTVVVCASYIHANSSEDA